MKKAYEKPLIEIVEFEVEDAIATSGVHLTGGGAGDDDLIFWYLIDK